MSSINRFSRFSLRIGSFLLGTALPFVARAQGGFSDRVLDGASTAGSPSGLTDAGDLEVVIGTMISTVLSLLGILLLGIMLYAGFLWMTAGGDEDNVKKARGLIMNSIIGMVIVFAAYAIVRFVLLQLVGPVTGETLN